MMARTSRDPGEGEMDMDIRIGYAYENGMARYPEYRVVEVDALLNVLTLEVIVRMS